MKMSLEKFAPALVMVKPFSLDYHYFVFRKEDDDL